MINSILSFTGAVLLGLGAAAVVFSVVGAYKFSFVMNRMHSVAVIDSLGMLFIVAGLILLVRDMNFIPKLILILTFQWIGSPIASHMVSRLEVETDDTAKGHMRVEEEKNELS